MGDKKILWTLIAGVLLGIGIELGFKIFKIDLDRKIGDSYFYIYITVINTIVMSILTFSIYRVNLKMADTNDDMVRLNTEILELNKHTISIDEQVAKVNKQVADITAFQVFTGEIRVQSRIISKNKEYMRVADIIKFATYPYLSINKKMELIKDALREDEIINKHSLTFNFPPEESFLNQDLNTINLKITMGVPLTPEENQIISDIESLFGDAMPSSITANWKVVNYKQSLSSLNNLMTDDDFFNFSNVSTIIIPWLNRINDLSSRHIINQPDNINFSEMNLNRHAADQIYLAISTVLDNLKSIEKHSLKLYSAAKEQLDFSFKKEE